MVTVGGGDDEKPNSVLQGAAAWGGGDDEVNRPGPCVEVGELAAEDDGVEERSRILGPTGELRDNLRAWTGEEVRDGRDKGGGDENLRHRRGDLLFRGSMPHEP